MKVNLKWIIPLVCITTTSAFAEPTLYPKDINVLYKVKNETTSNIIADHADSNTVWVMPPNTAKAVVSGMHTKNANMGFCKEMGDMQQYSRELSEQIFILNSEVTKKKQKYDLLKEKADAAWEEAERFAVEKNMKPLLDIDTRITDIEGRLTALYDKSNDCVNNCESLDKEIADLQKEKKDLVKMRNQLTIQYAADFQVYDAKRKTAAAAEKASKTAGDVVRQITSDLSGVRKSFLDTYQSFGQMEGARAAIKYISAWDANVESLRANNPGINFAKVATKNAHLTTEIASLKDIDPTGAIKRIDLGAVIKDGLVSLPDYPESFSTNVVLSLVGACPMEHPEYFDMTSNDPANIEYGVIITYDYDSVYTLNANVRYNMHKMYEKIVSSGSSGGFFSSRSWSNVSERNEFGDSLSVVINDPENTLTPEQETALKQEMVTSVMERLANFLLQGSPVKAELLKTGDAPTRGAVVASDSLMQVCPTNIYCMAGAAVFRVLDAIFGSSSSSSSYVNIVDTYQTEDFSKTNKITKSWITSYVK